MAEFNCYVCAKKLRSGEKFTFTKSGPVHFDCFVSSRRKEITDDKHEELRALSLVLDSELQHLINLLSIKSEDGNSTDLLKSKYKEIEKASGETTRIISNL